MNTFTNIRRRAFTIIELLVVISIIGLLTGLAATSYVNAQRNARSNAEKTDVDNIATAVESYYRVNQQFPGLIGDSSGPKTTQTTWQHWKGCMAIDSDTNSNIVYYYSPVSVSGANCGDASRGTVSGSGGTGIVFAYTDYQPNTSWIPGLGAYLNPLPVETRYQNCAGNTAALMDTATALSYTDPLVNGCQAQSLFYRHLVGGYMVYTRLENTQAAGVITQGATFSDQPLYPGGGSISVANSGIYLVRH